MSRAVLLQEAYESVTIRGSGQMNLIEATAQLSQSDAGGKKHCRKSWMEMDGQMGGGMASFNWMGMDG